MVQDDVAADSFLVADGEHVVGGLEPVAEAQAQVTA
jgi:hypothetical protein